MSYIVLARKYRPQTFSEVYAQEHITEILHNAILSNRIAHAYLFTGPRGVGKTSMARILAKSLNCVEGPTTTPCNNCHNCNEITAGVSPDVIEIDGASNTGVDDIRELQRELMYAPSQSKYKIYIIDEVHMLSKSAFNALLKTLEEPPENVLFIFATTEPHKVIATIISRCQRYDFKRIPIEAIVHRLKSLSQEEQIDIDAESMYLIARKADGGLRDALSLMDQVLSYCQDKVTIDKVRDIFGLIPNQVYARLLKLIGQRDSAALLSELQEIFEHGTDLQELVANMMEFIRIVILRQLGMAPADITADEYGIYDEIAGIFSANNLIYMMNYLVQTRNDLKSSGNPYLIMEMVMLKLCKMEDMADLSQILANLGNLKSGMVLTDTPGAVSQPATRATQPAFAEAKAQPSHHEEQELPQAEYNLENLKAMWDKIVARIKRSSTVTGIALNNYCKILRAEEFRLVLEVEGNSNLNTVKSNKEEIQKHLKEVFGRHIHLELQLSETQPPAQVNIVRKNLEDIKKLDPNLARYIEITDSQLSSGL